MDLLDTVGAEGDLGGEELDAVLLEQRRVNVGALGDGLALETLDQRASEASTGEGHGQSGGTSTILGLDNLVTAELDAVDQLVVSLTLDVGVVALGEQGHNGVTRVATDDGDLLVAGVGALELGNEAGGADNVEGGDTEQALGVVDALVLENLTNNGDGRVHRVRDDGNQSLGGDLADGLGEVADNGRISVEKVITGHARLAGDTGGNDDNVGTLDGSLNSTLVGGEALDDRLGVDVGDISGDTRSASEIVEGQLGDVVVELQEQRKGLANATSGTEDSDLVSGRSRRRESAARDHWDG